jgi:hypothetical protein
MTGRTAGETPPGTAGGTPALLGTGLTILYYGGSLTGAQ